MLSSAILAVATHTCCISSYTSCVPAVLNISHCNLTELPVDLGHVTSLKALVASHNSLTSPSLAHLASLTSLNSLILSDNKLTSIPSSLTRSKELKKLALSNNALHSDTLSEFEQMDSLEEVRLNGNTSITSIPDSLCTCKRLTLLELSHTGISKLKHIEKLSRCPRLINLGLRGTPLAESSDYREKVTTVVPQLRILDNIRFDKKFLDRKAQRDDASAWRAQPSRQDRGESYKNTEPDETAPREKKRKRHAHVPDGESPLDESVKSAATEQGTIQGKRKRAAKDNLPEPAHIKAPKSIGGTLADANSDASHKKIPQSAASMPVNAAADPAQARSSVLKVVDVRKEESKDRKQRKREKRERERQDASGTNLVADLIANTRSTVVSGWD